MIEAIVDTYSSKLGQVFEMKKQEILDYDEFKPTEKQVENFKLLIEEAIKK